MGIPSRSRSLSKQDQQNFSVLPSFLLPYFFHYSFVKLTNFSGPLSDLFLISTHVLFELSHTTFSVITFVRGRMLKITTDALLPLPPFRHTPNINFAGEDHREIDQNSSHRPRRTIPLWHMTSMLLPSPAGQSEVSEFPYLRRRPLLTTTAAHATPGFPCFSYFSPR
ncbi:MAG: hypothetical protein BJ554DRAFT_8172 [Olpidium bornovanus]|uniref:Uncharacterized protein n=1 Tax=Olpidium bornovanus TaxID=278681 RepID=A0A8H8A1W5_9FUNG|nr:MAG: hypothetical protein BJ554DRAFT_8172 [Olpidium bornovanus]